MVKFETGTSGTTIKDQIKGNQTIDYVLNANAGQILEVNFKASNGACYFNLMAPGEQYVAYYNPSIDFSSYHGVLKKSGEQKIRVYLMRSTARRNESGEFTLETSVKSKN